jgi:hypothetical protein
MCTPDSGSHKEILNESVSARYLYPIGLPICLERARQGHYVPRQRDNSHAMQPASAVQPHLYRSTVSRARTSHTSCLTGRGPPTPTKKMIKKQPTSPTTSTRKADRETTSRLPRTASTRAAARTPSATITTPPLVGKGGARKAKPERKRNAGAAARQPTPPPPPHFPPPPSPQTSSRAAAPPPLGKILLARTAAPAAARPSDLAGTRREGWGRALGSPTRRGRTTPAGAPAAGRGAGARVAAGGRGGGRRRRAPRRWRPSRRPRCPARRLGPTRPAITGPTATPRSKVGGWDGTGQDDEQAARFGFAAGF